MDYLQKECQILTSCVKRLKANKDKSKALLDQSSPLFSLLSDNPLLSPPNWQEWMNTPFETNPFHPESKIHTGISGNTLRSKSEYMIDAALFSAQIPFRYECQLILGDSTFYPDFTILHPVTGQIIYWEHFGLMDQPSYAAKTFHKLNLYSSHDILLNSNLIATFETASHPLTYTQIERIIEAFLKA